MKRFVIIVSVILLSPSFLVSAEEDITKSTGVVSHVFDGDTIRVKNRTKHVTIRLYGIDTPEMDQPLANDAKIHLQSLLSYRSISYIPLYYDDYNRLVAHVYLGDIHINQILVKEGLAWVHIYYCGQKICDDWKSLQQLAKIKKIGLWKDPDPVPPWVWKRRKK